MDLLSIRIDDKPADLIERAKPYGRVKGDRFIIYREAWEAIQRDGPVPENLARVQEGVSDCDDAPDHGPGTVLTQMVGRDKLKCGRCREWACKMNKWGPDGCVEHREEIIDVLLQGAEELGRPHQQAAAVYASEMARRYIGHIVDKAIEQARQHGQGMEGEEDRATSFQA